MALNQKQYEGIKPFIHKDIIHPHEARLLWETFCHSEGFSLGSPTCPDCVFKMLERMRIRTAEFEAAQVAAEQKAKEEETNLEKAIRETKDYTKDKSEE